MVQGGDPTGTGKGGASIWGGAFDDEFHPQNRVRGLAREWMGGEWRVSLTIVCFAMQHNCRGIVSMANSGPNTNKQQFFITYAKQPHLNNVYTVFGKYVRPIQFINHLHCHRHARRVRSYNKYPRR
jgi:peptidyl-prolyl cis-trans isomerase-like 3